MNRLWLAMGGGGAWRLPAAGAGGIAARNTAVAVALAGGSVAYMRSYPRTIPAKAPGDAK